MPGTSGRRSPTVGNVREVGQGEAGVVHRAWRRASLGTRQAGAPVHGVTVRAIGVNTEGPGVAPDPETFYSGDDGGTPALPPTPPEESVTQGILSAGACGRRCADEVTQARGGLVDA